MSDMQLNINVNNLNSLLKLKYGGDDKSEIKEHSAELDPNIEKMLEGKKECSLDVFAAILTSMNNK